MKKNELTRMRKAIQDAGHNWEARPSFLHDLDDPTNKTISGIYVPRNNEPELSIREIQSKTYAPGNISF